MKEKETMKNLSKAKKIINSALDSLGYEIRRKRSTNILPISPYTSSVLALASQRQILKVAIVGANDGRTNDPLFATIRDHLAGRSKIVLVEPQAALRDILQETYSFHPDAHVVQCAIGEGGDMTLHAVRSEYWPKTQPRYAEGWPTYRAPTGVTSVNRAHVINWVRRVMPDCRNPEAAVEALVVPCKKLPEVLNDVHQEIKIDVLQVDAEGADDLVISSCSVEVTRPVIIYFEEVHLPDERARDLKNKLDALGYLLFRLDNNTLAIHQGLA